MGVRQSQWASSSRLERNQKRQNERGSERTRTRSSRCDRRSCALGRRQIRIGSSFKYTLKILLFFSDVVFVSLCKFPMRTNWMAAARAFSNIYRTPLAHDSRLCAAEFEFSVAPIFEIHRQPNVIYHLHLSVGHSFALARTHTQHTQPEWPGRGAAARRSTTTSTSNDVLYGRFLYQWPGVKWNQDVSALALAALQHWMMPNKWVGVVRA